MINKYENMLFTMIYNFIKYLGVNLTNMCKTFSEKLYNCIERNWRLIYYYLLLLYNKPPNLGV